MRPMYAGFLRVSRSVRVGCYGMSNDHPSDASVAEKPVLVLLLVASDMRCWHPVVFVRMSGVTMLGMCVSWPLATTANFKWPVTCGNFMSIKL